jgi:3-phenylpropionate/trans-cinnamate dioxygenase ferredoxin reductase component
VPRRPRTASETRYLIVGAGMTGHAAARAIREQDPDGSILLVGLEPHPPYNRPPLTKGLWKGDAEESIWRPLAGPNVELRLERRIVELDLDGSTAKDDHGETHSYDRLLLATGGRPRELPVGDDDGVVYYRTLDDYRHVRDALGTEKRVAVIGGGFIGSELAAAFALNGHRVTMLFPGPAISARVFPAELAEFVTGYYREKGVEVLTGEQVTGIARKGAAVIVTTEGGRTVEADLVVAGLGIEPNTELAVAAGLPVDDGIVVDEYGHVGGRDDVYAAGDVVRFPSAALGMLSRVEHEDHANTHGAHVGANMAGAGRAYTHLPFFYSDLFDLGYEAVGETDPRGPTLEHWVEPNRKGIVCYLDDQRQPRGFLLWNVWDRVDAARQLIRAGEEIDDAALARLADG